MKYLLHVIIFLLTINLSSCQNQKENQNYSVINLYGAKVYAKPSFSSKVVSEIKLGEFITSERAIEAEEQKKIGNGLELNGKWIKINVGYVFSSDLSNKNVETGKNSHGQPYVDLLGNLLRKNSEKKNVKTENGEFPKYLEYKYYENGTYVYTAWDGCFDHVITYRNLDLHEVYHQMVSDYHLLLNDNEIVIPNVKKVEENVFWFEDLDAIQDLKIERNKDGSFSVSSYDCT